MDMADYFWVTVIVSGAVYILYRSVFKKKGGCHGCSAGTCSSKPDAKK